MTLSHNNCYDWIQISYTKCDNFYETEEVLLFLLVVDESRHINSGMFKMIFFSNPLISKFM